MCRHLAYLGPSVAVASLIYDAPHALAVQARDPRHVPLTSGDGFGVVWWDEDGSRRVRSVQAIWDGRFDGASSDATAVIASARAATPGGPVEEVSTAPFVADGWAFSLNGFIERYREGNAAMLRGMVSRRRGDGIEGDVDTSVLFALVLDQLDLEVSPREALANVHAVVRRVSSAPLNMLLTDGTRLAATASGHSLWLRAADGAVTIASEPLDDDTSWTPVPEDALVSVGDDEFEMIALSSPFVERESSPWCAIAPGSTVVG